MDKVTAVVICVFFSVPLIGSCQEKPSPVEFDEFAPDTWEKAVGALREKQADLVAKLINIAKDPDRKPKDRDRAVLLLGKIKDQRCIDFLVASVQMKLPPFMGFSESDARERPCYFVLTRPENRGDWNIAKAVLKSLESEKTRDELTYLMYVYQTILGGNAALALVDVELGNRPTPERRKRLEYFKANIRD